MKSLTTTVFCLFAVQAADDAKSIQGTWLAVEYDQHGKRPNDEIVKKMRVVIKDGKMAISPKIVAQYKPVSITGQKPEIAFSVDSSQKDEATFKLNLEKGWIDLIWTGPRGETKTVNGMYVLEDGALKICFPVTNNKRPKKIPDEPKAGFLRMVLVRGN